MSRIASRALVALALLSRPVWGGDWPQFRGPTGQGVSDETQLPLTWSETRNVRWRTPVAGNGWSSPVVAEGRVWVTTARVDGTVSLRALAFDVSTGELLVDTEVFSQVLAAQSNPKNTYASPSPILDDDRVYVHFGAEGTAALTADGEVVWRRTFPYRSQHGNGGSGVLWGDLLIVACDGDDRAFVVALDKRTGAERWRTPRPRPIAQAYSTPLVIRVGGQDQLVAVGAFRTIAYDPATGSEIWRVRYGQGFSNVPRPVYGHGLVYIATGFQQPALLAVRADGRGDVTDTHVAWKMRRGAPHTPSPLLVGDELYVINDGGIATCLDAKTGTQHWQRRIGGNHSASPVYADGRIYFQSEEGTTTVIRPGTQPQILATSQVPEATLASLAVADRSFFLRARGALYRIGLE
ncbi:MAG: PQQ-binding-like beta-propeller repeat protein [Acidobacteriota bacterium]|nr:PQQ-binding-like beta-propeller repeat protein [Acidobacteriota bacterium]